MSVVVPYHQIFHKHSAKNTVIKDITQVNDLEKSCCKPNNFFHKDQVILPENHFIFSSSSSLYKVLAYLSIDIKTLYNLSNKAPPVIIA